MTSNALNLYVSTCRLALLATTSLLGQSEEGTSNVAPSTADSTNTTTNGDSSTPSTTSSNHDDAHWTVLYRMLPSLRRALACSGCGQLCPDPVQAVSTSDIVDCVETTDAKFCCRPCAASGATVRTSLEGRLLIKCYRKLCQYLASTNFRRKFGTLSANGGVRTLADLIHEGASLRPSQDEQESQQVNLDLQRRPGIHPTFVSPLVTSSPTIRSLISSANGAGGGQTRPHPARSAGKPNGAAAAFRTASSTMSTPRPSLYSVSRASNHSTRITIKRKRQQTVVRPTTSNSPDSAVCLATVSATTSSVVGFKRKETPQSVQRRRQERPVEQQQQAKRRRTMVRDLSTGSSKKVVISARSSVSRPCQCGSSVPSTATGKFTCRGQRCPCFAAGRTCVGCACRERCKNPCRSGGRRKVDYAERATSSTGSDSSETTSASSSSSSTFSEEA